MGVPGLWDLIRPAGTTRSLTHLSVVDGFEENIDGVRGFRVGIDASIWFFHAQNGREGENPELRTLFFKCTKLMTSPFLPLFVFDGPKRPSVKRGKRIKGDAHWLTSGMKRIIEAFGFEWRTAPGEAEAELAYLNRIGVIDAVLSDDVDNFLFGATMVIRNPSATLTGNKSHIITNSDGKSDTLHTYIYTSESIASHPSVQLSLGGLILIGLLSGGDYHEAGLQRCGPKFAHGLAKCGFGDSLLNATRTLPRSYLPDFLATWRDELREELRTNSQGHIGRKNPALASSVPNTFPDIDILLSYTNPITSETDGRGRNLLKVTWDTEPNLGKIASLCEQYFEWGYKTRIIKRFRNFMWPAFLCRILRRGVLDIDKKGILPSTPQKKRKDQPPPTGTPSKMIFQHFSKLNVDDPCTDDDDEDDPDERLIVKIHSSRKHASTDGILEYRLEIAPAQLVRLTVKGILGTRPPLPGSEDDGDEDGDDEHYRAGKDKKPPPDPDSHLRIWMPASMVKLAEPYLVDEYEGVERKKLERKTGKGGRKAKTAKAEDSDLITAPAKVKKASKGKRAPKATTILQYSSSEDDVMPTFGVKANRTKPIQSKTATVKDFFAVSKAPTKSTTTKFKAKKTCELSYEDHLEHVSSIRNLAPIPNKYAASTVPSYLELTDSEDDTPQATGQFQPTLSKSSHNRDDHLPYVSSRPSAKLSSHPKASTSKRTSHSQYSRFDSRSGSEEPLQPSTRNLQPFPMSFDDAFVVSSDSEHSSPPHSLLNSVSTEPDSSLRAKKPSFRLLDDDEVLIPQQSDKCIPVPQGANKRVYSSGNEDVATFVSQPSAFLRRSPISSDDEHAYRSECNGDRPPNRRFVNQARRKTAPTSSDSDSQHKHISKSPRKSKEHVSPRRLHLTDRKQDEREHNRPASPSPLGRSLSRAASGADAIEISSDSDAPPSRSELPPLVLAKKRAQKKSASRGVYDPLKLLSINEGQVHDNIIDLT